MIQITNNTKDFIENGSEEIIIYGAGNAGYWVGYYMNRCNIDFSCYIDKTVDKENSTYNGKPIFLPDILRKYKDRSLRIIVTPTGYESVLSDLLWLEHLYGFHAICLVPRHTNITTGEDIYHINKLLSYFRGKLLQGKTPTIFCNSCLAGRIYELFDRMMLSPTINTLISPDDFVKLCKNSKYYMNLEMESILWKRPFGNPGRKNDSPCGVVGDIEICFGHTDSESGLIERWNTMRKRINWSRVIFILTEQPLQLNIPVNVVKDFFALNGEKLFISTHSFFACGKEYEHIYMPELHLQNPASAVENYFDILGWFNQEYID